MRTNLLAAQIIDIIERNRNAFINLSEDFKLKAEIYQSVLDKIKREETKPVEENNEPDSGS